MLIHLTWIGNIFLQNNYFYFYIYSFMFTEVFFFFYSGSLFLFLKECLKKKILRH